MEIERKFWIDTLPELPEERRSDVYQGYLCTEPVELRIRKRVEAGGEIVYQLCVKSIGKLSRHEVETELSRAQFEELASMLDKPLIHKEYHAYRLRAAECFPMRRWSLRQRRMPWPGRPWTAWGRKPPMSRG